MMLVVAVALSTATYAWFTSNTKVSANEVILTASTMNADAILISRSADNSGLSQSIVLQAQGDDKLYPATPLANTAFTTGFDSLSGAAFQNVIMDGTGKYVAQTITDDDKSYYTDTFYVYNKGFSAVTLSPVITIYYDGTNAAAVDAAQSVRIALIEKKGTAVSSSNVTLGSATLKGIYQFGSAAVNYVAAPSTYDDDIETYYKDATGTAWDGDTVTSSNYDDLKASLFVASGNKSVAVAGANGNYGVTGTSDNYSQNTVSFEGIVTAFQQIDAPASGTYVANQYSLVIWLEGWDGQCTNAMSAGTFRVDITFTKAA